MKYDTDVLIIGAGPTGLTLANVLGLRGVKTLLVEARNELIDFPRAVGIDDEALRGMQAIGLIDQVLPHTVPDQKIRIVNGQGKLVQEINPTTREFGWPRRNGFVQPLVDAVLLEGAKRFDSVTIQFGAEAIALTQDSDSVTVTVREHDGTKRDIVAKYLIGAEGGRSFSRAELGLTFDGETRKSRGLVVDVRNDPLGHPHAIFGGDPAAPYATLRLPHGIRRWEFNIDSSELPDEVLESDEHVRKLFARHVPDPSKLDIIRRRIYVHHARIASRFRVGRVLLAGDAAHVMPVVAGQGWNSCIRDAINLGWKLDWVIRGHASDDLLDTYASERHAHVKAIVQLSVNMARVAANQSRFQSFVRDSAAVVIKRVPRLQSYFSQMRFKPLPNYVDGVSVPSAAPKYKSVYVSEQFQSFVGRLFPQPRVSTSAKRDILLDDATGVDWRIIMWDNDPAAFLEPATRQTFEKLGGSLVDIVPIVELAWTESAVNEGVRVVGDHSGAVKTWFDARPFSAFIVRPDNVIAAECLAQELESTLKQVFTAARLVG